MPGKVIAPIRKWWSDVTGSREYFRYYDKEDRKRRLGGQFLTLITIILGIIYLIWHCQNINWDIW